MKSILAVYENGVFRPVEPVDLPEHSRVRLEPELVSGEEDKGQNRIYEILSRRFATGATDTAERHNEHQP